MSTCPKCGKEAMLECRCGLNCAWCQAEYSDHKAAEMTGCIKALIDTATAELRQRFDQASRDAQAVWDAEVAELKAEIASQSFVVAALEATLEQGHAPASRKWVSRTQYEELEARVKAMREILITVEHDYVDDEYAKEPRCHQDCPRCRFERLIKEGM